jgi:hypothetical protein
MNAEASDPAAAPPTTKTDRYVKLGFLIVTVGIVGWLIVQPHISFPMRGWDTDLQAALTQAAAESRSVVAMVYDSPQNLAYSKLREVVSKAGNREAMQKANVICVHVRLDSDDPLAKQFEIKEFPTTLLIGSDGKAISRWTGYIGEVAFRQEFLQGEPQRR